MKRELRLAAFADTPPEWQWIAPELSQHLPLNWNLVSTLATGRRFRLPGVNLDRARAAIALRTAFKQEHKDAVISIGPNNSCYVEALAQLGRPRVPHLAWGFNFTDLPIGARARWARRFLRSVDQFAVFSTAERRLYSEFFEIPIERFRFVHWGVKAPIAEPRSRTVNQRYVVALGGEARDYATLCEAASRLPSLHFVLIVRPNSLANISVPGNVKVFVNLPATEAWTLVWYADVAVVPLRNDRTPNGHVTLVGGMHLGKAQVVTDSIGVYDYVSDEQTALLAPAQDAKALGLAIERLVDDDALRCRIGNAARDFANANCTEETTVAFVRQRLLELTRQSN